MTSAPNEEITVYRADLDIPWPGKAGVVVTTVWATKAIWNGKMLLSGKQVERISSQLSNDTADDCKKLNENTSISFNGSYLLGDGFVVSPEEAAQWIAEDKKYADVVLPYINGIELYSFSDLSPRRRAICFWDWPESKAKEYMPWKRTWKLAC